MNGWIDPKQMIGSFVRYHGIPRVDILPLVGKTLNIEWNENEVAVHKRFKRD